METDLKQLKALQRLYSMGDWLKLPNFDCKKLTEEIQSFENQWPIYNPRKLKNRYGLSVTSLDGGISGVPDLDSLFEYNNENGTQYNNQSFKSLTPVYHASPELQKILEPYLPWLGRCHFIRLEPGGYFPEHYDIGKFNYDEDEIRLIGMVQNTDYYSFKFCYEKQILTHLYDGELYYFNANKTHSVFAMDAPVTFLVITLKFTTETYETLVKNYVCS